MKGLYLHSFCLLVQVLLLLDYARGQAMTDPGQKLLLGLSGEESERLSQIFVDLSRHRYLELEGQTVHELAQSVYVFAVLILDGN